MSLSFSALGSKVAQDTSCAVGCIVLLAVYRKLNDIPFDRDDFRELLKMFSSYVLAGIVGLALVSLFRWIFHI